MLTSPIDALHEWRDFYVAIGMASATLLGAMFVVASIGSGFLTQERATGIRLFLTPTVMHLSTVLLGCALAMVPSLEGTSLGILFGLGSLVGLAYSCRVGVYIRRHPVELSDRLWYAGVPIVAYAVMMVAALMALLRFPASLEVLAIALALILVAGIRNAWDLILFIVAQAKGPN